MKLSTNVIGFSSMFGIHKTVDIFAQAGFQGIDFNTDLEEFHNNSHHEAFYRALKIYAADRGIQFYQSHAPFPSAFPEDARTKQQFAKIVTGM